MANVKKKPRVPSSRVLFNAPTKLIEKLDRIAGSLRSNNSEVIRGLITLCSKDENVLKKVKMMIDAADK